jgi:thiamine kinase-like enzyme
MTTKSSLLIIRKYGKNTDFFIDRFFEIRVIEALEPYDITRNILTKLENGLIEQYLEGAFLNNRRFQNPLLIGLLGKRLSELHLVNILSPNERKNLWYGTE